MVFGLLVEYMNDGDACCFFQNLNSKYLIFGINKSYQTIDGPFYYKQISFGDIYMSSLIITVFLKNVKKIFITLLTILIVLYFEIVITIDAIGTCFAADLVFSKPQLEEREIVLETEDQNEFSKNQLEYIKRKVYLLKEENEIIRKKNQLEDAELLAQLIQAEAGNQGIFGMRYVADVVLNRVDSNRFSQNNIREVIYSPGQFSVMRNGAFQKAGYNISNEAYQAAIMEIKAYERLDSEILYFSSTEKPVNGKNAWKYKNHWFSY